MKLICEAAEDVKYQITEAKETGKKNFYITGVFAEANSLNKNKRVYPKHIMEKAVNTYIQEKVNTHRAFGELDHPSGPKINPDRISHLIEELEWNGNQLYGKAKILDTPMGNIARGIMEGGGSLGVSTRGMGEVKKNPNGIMEVQEGLRYSTIADIVTDPSAHNAWVNSIMENTEFYYDNFSGEWQQKAIEETVKEIKTMSKRQLEEQSYISYHNFIKSLLR